MDTTAWPLFGLRLRLTADQWRAAGHGRDVTVTGFAPCRPWFG
jgi:hypothetical protein